MIRRVVAGWTRAAGAALAALMVFSRLAVAHPIHTTLTVITPDEAGRVLTLNIRVFVDDFSASVARFAGRTPPADSSVLPDEARRYVHAHFSVSGRTGEAVALEPCGVSRSREVYWLCFRARLPSSVHGAKVRNQMLTELHADQVNIVQLEDGALRRSFLFTRGSDPSALP
ncbi:MAG TPA: DUF6702 family protein [Gemmatimonadaceae bacterium]|nr:DUF6702 family protein [Gemmatimonadaceae bacterium]